MKKNDSREAFNSFCDTVRNTEKDKDRFLEAAHLQRIERAPTFTAGQLIGLVILVAIVLLGSVAMVCLAITGKTGYILPALGVTLLVLFLSCGVTL